MNGERILDIGPHLRMIIIILLCIFAANSCGDFLLDMAKAQF